MASEVNKSNGAHRRNSKTVLLRRILRQKSGLLGAFLILLFLVARNFFGIAVDPYLSMLQRNLSGRSTFFCLGHLNFGDSN